MNVPFPIQGKGNSHLQVCPSTTDLLEKLQEIDKHEIC